MTTFNKHQRWLQAKFVERVLAESALRAFVLTPARRARILAVLFAEMAKLRAT